MLLLIILVHQMLVKLLMIIRVLLFFISMLSLISIIVSKLIYIVLILLILSLLHFSILWRIICISLEIFIFIGFSLVLAEILLIILSRFAELRISKQIICVTNKFLIGVQGNSDFVFSNLSFEIIWEHIIIFLFIILRIDILTVYEIELSWFSFFLNHA